MHAPAKVNLALHVTGQRDDGYHLLDSIVTFTEFGDRLLFYQSDALTLTVEGPESDGLPVDDKNLILIAAKALMAASNNFNLGMHIALEKNLPSASGMGGGSSNAAATLLALNELWRLGFSNQKLAEIGLPLGADIPMCLMRENLRAQGTGELLEPIELPRTPILLANPRVPVSTPGVFKALRSRNNAPIHWESMGADMANSLASTRNDLEAPARILVPVIDDVLGVISQQQHCQISRMTGSGATCFGLFETQSQAENAAHSIQSQNPDWWVVATQTIA